MLMKIYYYIKMQVYQAKIDDQISSLVTETEGHVSSQNQAISACQNIVKEKTDKEVFMFITTIFWF